MSVPDLSIAWRRKEKKFFAKPSKKVPPLEESGGKGSPLEYLEKTFLESLTFL